MSNGTQISKKKKYKRKKMNLWKNPQQNKFVYQPQRISTQIYPFLEELVLSFLGYASIMNKGFGVSKYKMWVTHS